MQSRSLVYNLCAVLILSLFCNDFLTRVIDVGDAYGRSQMLTQNDFAVITKLDTVSGAASQRSSLLQDQPEQVSLWFLVVGLDNWYNHYCCFAQMSR